jgi:hypothetical protein
MRSTIIAAIVLSLFLSVRSRADLSAGFFNPYVTTGPRVSVETLSPTLRKWYLPQTLYFLYGWKTWEYTNYAKDNYERYTDILQEGNRHYDLYGNYISRGWRIYEWDQEHPVEFGSGVWKAPEFGSWFNRLLISSTSKGQFHTALTVGEMLRTTLTPLTFSKPLFDGIQWDAITDRYAMTIIASRINNPATVAITKDDPLSSATVFTNLVGVRGVAQVGDFLKLGGTYVNAGHWNSGLEMGKNSLKGTLGGRLNTGNARRLVVRLSDDSPEDGVGGALLFRERIFIDGVEHPEVKALVDGGVRRRGLLEASGSDVAVLTYDIERDLLPGVEDKITDFKEIHKIEVELVLANDYVVEVTSNLQTNNTGEPVFLPVARARGNIKDGSNQGVLRFRYGLPTANEVVGLTAEVTEVRGFNLRAEYDVNRRFRRFPNQSITHNQVLAKDRAEAFYVTASQEHYPWFAYGEMFSMDYAYNTSMFTPDGRGVVDYGNAESYLYEFVDDNDDQDRYPDWTRRYSGGGSRDTEMKGADRTVFPGYDENNDLVSDFNQNSNSQPDYAEPFIRYNVDPLEFLFGTDMNNNTVIDRFENDREPDYPYKRDHRGFNAYGGVEITPGSRFLLGHLREWRLSDDRRSKSIFGMLTWTQDFPDQDLKTQFFDLARSVADNLPDDVVLWVQPPFSNGVMQDLPDPLIAQDALVNTAYLQMNCAKFAPLNLTGKIKHEIYHQRGDQRGRRRDQRLLAFVAKADYAKPVSANLTLWPKWKQLYLRQTPADRNRLRSNELSDIFFFVNQYKLTGNLRLESGIEYEIFRNMVRRPDPIPPGYDDDFGQLVLAAQFANTSAYLGYKLVANIGGRWERKSLRTETETNTVLFLKIFAGVQEF